MKKTILTLLLVVILIFSAAGCATPGNPPAGISDSAGASEPALESEPASVSEPAGDTPNEPEAPIAVEPPDNDWQFDTPENHGVDSEILSRLHDAAAGETGIYSIVTAKDGYIIDEYYNKEYNENSVFRFASCTKSVSGALIGVAIEQGLIGGVDVKLSEYFPELADSDSAYKQEITLEHLLTHTSGFEWYEWNGGTMFREFTQSENWVEFVLNRPMASEPGAVFNYTTGGSHMLAAVLQKATGKTAYEFGVENLFEPMGMDSVEWRSDPQGVTDGGNGISMTARDAAKFGQLYLDGGRWKNRQILPETWVEESVMVQYERSSNSGSYGYQWWLRPFGTGNYDTYYAMGHGGQYIFVVPELKLVTVITSRFQDTYAPWPYFTDYVLAACEQGAQQ